MKRRPNIPANRPAQENRVPYQKERAFGKGFLKDSFDLLICVRARGPMTSTPLGVLVKQTVNREGVGQRQDFSPRVFIADTCVGNMRDTKAEAFMAVKAEAKFKT